MADRYDVFLSFDWQERAVARRIREALIGVGAGVWFAESAIEDHASIVRSAQLLDG